MITPRRTRLLRVPDLHAFRSAINATAAPSGLVIVPTRSAARQLGCGVTREELYDALHARLRNPPRRLTAIERDAMAQAAARTAAASGVELSFRLRPGLVAEMLRFYDQLRRQAQQVGRFAELIDEALGGDDSDRAAERMRRHTRFLVDAFREYERRVRESGACDEHLLRERLVTEAAVDPVRHVVVTVADWIGDPDGLFVADFDLLSRIPGLASLDIVATEAVLGSGFHERLHNWLPGIEEVRGPNGRDGQDGEATKPRLVVSPDAASDEPWWTFRDREEELIAVAQRVAAGRSRGDAAPLEKVAVVYKHPLPYLYMAPEVFRAAGIPFRTHDALPLAAEPTSASIDLVLDAVSSDFSRVALVALLRSPHFLFVFDGVEPTRQEISALDRRLSEARYLGGIDRLESFPMAMDLARGLAPLGSPQPASMLIEALREFWWRHLRPIDDADPLAGREQRARTAIDNLLQALSAAYAAQDDPVWSIDDLALGVRRGIEEQTFEVTSGGQGVHLLDDRAARYGAFDDVTIVGLVETEWPERTSRNIFYPPGMLKSLGWASEKDRHAGADARFLDLLAASRRWTTLSAFTLDDEMLVSRSIQLDEVPRAKLSTIAHARADDKHVNRSSDAFAGWQELRAARTSSEAPEFHGSIGTPAGRAWSVSALETYIGCPFRFFAQHVLKLDEEPDDEEVMDPRRQGRFVHEVFEDFFDAWQQRGHRAITPVNLETARELFREVVDAALERLPEAEAGLERTRLLGSPAAAGLGDAVMRMEAERPVPVAGRLLEHRLDGDFTFDTAEGPRTVSLRGKADRIDLLEDGTFRLIDYKLGWPPQRTRALQLAIYSLCAEQKLSSHGGRQYTLAEAAYLAFKGPRRVVPLFANDRVKVLADAQQRLVDTVDAIDRGEFPPKPDDVYRCETCSYAAVCRKDYVGEG